VKFQYPNSNGQINYNFQISKEKFDVFDFWDLAFICDFGCGIWNFVACTFYNNPCKPTPMVIIVDKKRFFATEGVLDLRLILIAR